ncbi:MAG: helix-turn-helix transcriptional regulator [Beijerinckiaceae bacterium]
MASNRLKADSKRAEPVPADGFGSNPPGVTGDDERYLADLGDRVRRIRAIRGMSRKVLAQTSGISERYIAQMEAGAGNVSIVLLRRIARATGVRIDDLIADVPENWSAIRDLLPGASAERITAARDILSGKAPLPQLEASAPQHGPRIALVGLRGAGKSSLGRLAGKALGIEFMELNQEIESHHGLSVTEIFKLYGQEGYRRLELQALKRLMERTAPFILATGGGIVAEAATYDLLRASFFTIWIKAQPDEHMNRVRQQGDLRPMANDKAAMEELVTILSSREPLYAKANAQIDTSARKIDACAAELAETIRKNFPHLSAGTEKA